MANPTTNFGWVMPTSTSLVTNLPADFNTFGQGVDTSLQYLLGGTTGQVLSKTSNTNMAFTWVTPTDQTPLTTKGDLFAFSTVDARLPVGANETRLVADSAQTLGLKYVADTTNYAINAKGDLLAGTAADTLAALTVGANNTVLTADSSTATGLKWATAASGDTGPSFSAYRTTSTQSISAGTFTKAQLNAEDWDTASAYDSTTNYRFTPQTAGYYTVQANGYVSYSAADCLLVVCYKNGSAWKNLAATDKPTGGGDTRFGGACQVYLNGSTDYIEMYVYSFNATTAIPTGSSAWQFSAALVRTA